MRRTGAGDCLRALALVAGLHAAPGWAHEPLAFDIDIALTPKAAERLRTAHEDIVVFARYYGAPTPVAARHVDEVGQISLSLRSEQAEMAGRAGRVRLTGATVDPRRFAWIAGGAKVNVNVASARRSSDDNILACDFIDADVAAVVKAQPITLRCGLIAEELETSVKP